jgi:hypothetical protein
LEVLLFFVYEDLPFEAGKGLMALCDLFLRVFVFNHVRVPGVSCAESLAIVVLERGKRCGRGGHHLSCVWWFLSEGREVVGCPVLVARASGINDDACGYLYCWFESFGFHVSL